MEGKSIEKDGRNSAILVLIELIVTDNSQM